MNEAAAVCIVLVSLIIFVAFMYYMHTRIEASIYTTAKPPPTQPRPNEPTSFGGSFKYDGKRYNFEESGSTIRPPSPEQDPFSAPPKAKYEPPSIKYAGNMYDWPQWSTSSIKIYKSKSPVSEPYDLTQASRMANALNAASIGMIAWVAYRHKNTVLMEDATKDYHAAILELKHAIRQVNPDPKMLDAIVTHDLERAYEELTGNHAR